MRQLSEESLLHVVEIRVENALFEAEPFVVVLTDGARSPFSHPLRTVAPVVSS